MTLHCWQHWFWITIRTLRQAPVAVLLIALAACHVRAQRLPWEPQEGVWLLQEPAVGGALGGVSAPVGLQPVLAVSPWSPWPARRLLGFAGSPRLAGPPGSPPDTGAPAPTVTYLTTPQGLGPGLEPGTSQPVVYTRQPKAIGVPPTTAPSAGTALTATSVLQIVEDLAGTASPATAAASPSSAPEEDPSSPASPAPESVSAVPSASSPTAESGGTEDGAAAAVSSAEMPADEPARDASSASPTEPVEEESTGSPPAVSSRASSTSPRRDQPAPPSTPPAPAHGQAGSDAPSAAPSAEPSPSTAAAGGATSTTTAAQTRASVEPTAAVTAVHPGLSPPRRSTPVPTAPAPAPAGTRPSSTEPAATTTAKHHLAGALSLSSGGGLDAGSITGIVLGIVVFAGLVGTVSFVLYRRRYLNKPQTLNDKCSNPDSSGYIDDSTLRENSEEMYSLDNDSFLNSLEAMTIQNYWTDTVKHTKL